MLGAERPDMLFAVLSILVSVLAIVLVLCDVDQTTLITFSMDSV